MLYKLNNSVKLFNINDINMIGNINNGSIIGLDSNGLSLVKKIMNNYSIDIDDLDDNSKELLENMIELDFFDDKEENSKLNSAYVHITDNCNLHCIGCYSYIDNRNTSKDLSLEQICIIFDK